MNLGPRYAIAELLLVPPPIELCAQPVVNSQVNNVAGVTQLDDLPTPRVEPLFISSMKGNSASSFNVSITLWSSGVGNPGRLT